MLSLLGQLFGFSKDPLESSQLFVTNIDETITVKTFGDFFSQFQGFQQVEFVNSPDISTKSAYVRFAEAKHAEIAKERAQYELLGQKNIRISFHKEKEYCLLETVLFIENLPQGCTNKDLRDHFSQVGIPICFAKVDNSREGQVFGRGYILFETKNDVEIALQQMEGKKFNNSGLKLSCLSSIGKKHATKKTLYVENLPRNKTFEELKEFLTSIMSECGKIKHIAIEMDTYSALIAFNEQDDAEAAFNYFTKDEKLRKKIDISWSQKHEFESNSRTRKMDYSRPLGAQSNKISPNYDHSYSQTQFFDEERKTDFTRPKNEHINKQEDTTISFQLENPVAAPKISTFEQDVNIPVPNYNSLNRKKKSQILTRFLFPTIRNILLEKLLPQTISILTDFSKLNVIDVLMLVKNSNSLKEIIPKIVESVESKDEFDMKKYIQSINTGDIDEINQQKTGKITAKACKKVQNDLTLEQKLGMRVESFCNLNKKTQLRFLQKFFKSLVHPLLLAIRIHQIKEIISFLSDLPLEDVLVLFENNTAFKIKIFETIEYIKIKGQKGSEKAEVPDLENETQMQPHTRRVRSIEYNREQKDRKNEVDNKEEYKTCSDIVDQNNQLSRVEYQMRFCDSEVKRRDIKGSAVKVKIESSLAQAPDILEQLIYDKFSAFGKINEYFIKQKKKKFGLVLVYEKKEAAENARSCFRSNKDMKVVWYTPPSSSKRKVSVLNNEKENINQEANIILSQDEPAGQLRDKEEKNSALSKFNQNVSQEAIFPDNKETEVSVPNKHKLKARIKIHLNVEYSKFKRYNKAQKEQLLEQFLFPHIASLTHYAPEVLNNFKSKRWFNICYILDLVENKELLQKRIGETMKQIGIEK